MEIKRYGICSECGKTFRIRDTTNYFVRRIEILPVPYQKVYKYIMFNSIMRKITNYFFYKINKSKIVIYKECPSCYRKYKKWGR